MILPRLKTFSKIFTTTSLLFIFITCPLAGFAKDLPQLIRETEQEYNVPEDLLAAIAHVESGNKPYMLNVSGEPVVVDSKEEAVQIASFYQALGITDIDPGLAQINLHWHGSHFNSIEEMPEPHHNLKYAVKFLRELYKQHGSWSRAVRHYHSVNSKHHVKYSHKVLMAWLKS